MMNRLDKIDTEEALARIASAKDRLQRKYDVVLRVRPVLESFDGKQLNKRIVTAVTEALPHHTAAMTRDSFDLNIVGCGIPYSDPVSIRLHRGAFPGRAIRFSFEECTNNGLSTYLKYPERIRELDEALDKVRKWAEEWNALVDTADDMEKSFGEARCHLFR